MTVSSDAQSPDENWAEILYIDEVGKIQYCRFFHGQPMEIDFEELTTRYKTALVGGEGYYPKFSERVIEVYHEYTKELDRFTI